MSHSITCPSGLTGEIRGLTVREANLLADGASQKKGNALDEVLRSCWETVEDPGPYELKDGKLPWPQLLVADRMHMLVRVRVATHGPEYSFPLQCKAPNCRQRFDYEMNLDEDVPVKPVPEESIATFKAGNRFPVEFPSTGRHAVFQLMTTALERSHEKLVRQNRDRIITAALASRLVSIDGVNPNDKLKFLDDLSMGDADALLVAMDEADGGLETTLEVDCPHCYTTQEVELPFGKEFWLPQRQRQRAATTAARSD